MRPTAQATISSNCPVIDGRGLSANRVCRLQLEYVPELVIALMAMGDFQSMIHSKTARKLDEWLEVAKSSLVGSFAGGVERDMTAVRNAVLSPWSIGQTEGQITRLKLIRRQIYGRAKNSIFCRRS